MVRRLLKSAQQREGGPVSSDNNNASAAGETKHSVAGEHVDAEKTQNSANDKRGGKSARKKRPSGGDGGPKERTGREGKETALVPSWLFAHLPFHDDHSFAMFFCEVLRDSERLAVRFG